MSRKTFFCVDAHTAGNPVRVVTGGGPDLKGETMNARREHFVADYDWIRTGLMFEPRGHDVMSGSILYPALREDVDGSILFIETSGCLPMCGHGTIGTVTVMVEEGLVTPRTPGRLRLEVPAGIIDCAYEQDAAGHVTSVKITNVPSFLYARDLEIDLPGVGPLKFDVAYGGNFYAIFDPQPGFADMAQFTAFEIQQLSPVARRLINEKYSFQHPQFPTIKGLRHVMWTGTPRHPEADGRNAVFYGEKAIDRSPCGTGTSARVALLDRRGGLAPDGSYTARNILGVPFVARIAERRGDAVVVEIEGNAHLVAHSTLLLESGDPLASGFLCR